MPSNKQAPELLLTRDQRELAASFDFSDMISRLQSLEQSERYHRIEAERYQQWCVELKAQLPRQIVELYEQRCVVKILQQ